MPTDRPQSSYRRSRSPYGHPEGPSSSKVPLEYKSNRRHRSHSRSPPPRRRDRERDRGRSPTPDRSTRQRSRSRSPSKRKHYASRSRSRSRDRDRSNRQKRPRSRSSSSSSDSDNGRSRRRREKRKDKKHSSSKTRKKREKREKKDKKRNASAAHWGKYGILSDVDIFAKQAEFHAWLVEERKVNPETVTKDQERKEFSRFMEDYNTATLPHEKYYNMEVYDKRMNALRQGEYLPPTDVYDFEADLKAVKSAHKKKPAEQESYLSREELMELRKVQQERVELGKMKLLGMDIKSTFGVRMDKHDFDD